MIGADNWAAYDQSQNHVGEQFAASVFDALPQNAVLLTYWDALTNLGYEHCVEGQRPDIALRSLDVAARVVCDPVDGSLEDVAGQRPLYALFVATGQLDELRASFDLRSRPAAGRAVRQARPGLQRDPLPARAPPGQRPGDGPPDPRAPGLIRPSSAAPASRRRLAGRRG